MRNTLLVLLSCASLFACTQPLKVYEADLVLDSKSTLGEGALWNDRTDELMWIDIEEGLFHRYNSLTGVNTTLEMGQKIGTVVPDSDNHYIVPLVDGIYRLAIEDSSKTLLAANPENNTTGNRFNDGKCDPAGRLWVGTVGEHESGGLYCLTQGTISQKLDKITCSNGIVWTADKKTMYYADSPTKEVWEFDYDNQTGEIRFVRVAISIEEGVPDGMTIDSEGNLWVAQWGGYCVGCYDPRTGKMIAKVNVPAKQVSSCAFGGKNRDILYITTAKRDITAEEIEKYPHTGSLFAVQTTAKGVETNLFAD